MSRGCNQGASVDERHEPGWEGVRCRPDFDTELAGAELMRSETPASFGVLRLNALGTL